MPALSPCRHGTESPSGPVNYGVQVQSVQAGIPSPTVSVIHLGPFPIHIYALCIVAGIAVALWVADRRWRARGGRPSDVGDVAGWAIIFGILGGRIYHVITDPELYFESGKHPLDAFKIWDGGLGIWGAITLGALGVYIGCRRHRMNFVAFADAAAPGVVLAQAVGRLGNWFNNELYGRPTTLAWKLQIHQMDVVTGKAGPVLGYFQPTFLYELLWDVLIGLLLIWADRRYRLARGQVFLLYVLGYTAGRFWVESLRSDTANHVLGMRVNSWVAIAVFLAALAAFVRQRGKPRSSAGSGPPALGPVPAPDSATEPDPDPESTPDPAPAHREVE
jgi:prolipoprotein diacylglyceryl transferase